MPGAEGEDLQPDEHSTVLREAVEALERENARLRARLAGGPRGPIGEAEAPRGPLGPPLDDGLEWERRSVWMLGSPRTGSTWLFKMLVGPEVLGWSEPYIGFALACDIHQDHPETGLPIRLAEPASDRVIGANFLHADMRAVWLPALRRFLQEILRGRFAGDGTGRPLLIKEPNGSEGADILLEALPEARMLYLVRDPRDVLDSLMDLHNPASWNPRGELPDAAAREAQIREYCRDWWFRMSASQRAFEALPETAKLLVRYEDLRARTPEVLGQVFEFLGVPRTPEQLRAAADAHAFEKLPRAQRGPGKFAREARPGAWRDHFSPPEVELLEQELGPWLERFGYSRTG